jgi:hypothetical protein
MPLRLSYGNKIMFVGCARLSTVGQYPLAGPVFTICPT